MNNPCDPKLICPGAPRNICASWMVLLLLAAPAVLQAQFAYTTNNGAITITGYTGPGGAVTIPNKINRLSVTGRQGIRCSRPTECTMWGKGRSAREHRAGW